jgi:hypothetical protein
MKIEPSKYYLEVLIGATVHEVLEHLKLPIGPDGESTTKGMFIPGNTIYRSYLILEADCTYGAIAHEAFHAAEHITRSMGDKPHSKNEEFRAYTLTNIVDEAVNQRDKYLEKLKK